MYLKLAQYAGVLSPFVTAPELRAKLLNQIEKPYHRLRQQNFIFDMTSVI